MTTCDLDLSKLMTRQLWHHVNELSAELHRLDGNFHKLNAAQSAEYRRFAYRRDAALAEIALRGDSQFRPVR